MSQHRLLQSYIRWDTLTCAELHYQPEMVAGFIPFVKSYNILVFNVMGETDLGKQHRVYSEPPPPKKILKTTEKQTRKFVKSNWYNSTRN